VEGRENLQTYQEAFWRKVVTLRDTIFKLRSAHRVHTYHSYESQEKHRSFPYTVLTHLFL
jgi:hypothetical protein